MNPFENLVIILFGVSMLYVAVSSRIESYVKALTLQGVCLFAMVAGMIGRVEPVRLVLPLLETLVLKSLVVPWFLTRIIRRNKIRRDSEPYLPNYYSVIISTLILVAGLYIAHRTTASLPGIKPLLFGISFSVMINGLFLIVTRRKIITQVMGYMLLENGIFLLSLSVAEDMPMLVDMGVLLDIFIGVFLLGFFVNRISATFDEARSEVLTQLKD
jgi:hydrogenase-4 component E